MTTQEIKNRINTLTTLVYNKATTFNGCFRLVMKELKTGNENDKMIYKAIKKAGSKKVKAWIDESLQNLSPKF